MRLAIISRTWSTHSTGQVDAGDVSWRHFTTNLHAAIIISREVNAAPSHPSNYSDDQVNDMLDTFMTRYGSDPRTTREHLHSNSRPPYSDRQNPTTRRLDHQNYCGASSSDSNALTFIEARILGVCLDIRTQIQRQRHPRQRLQSHAPRAPPHTHYQ